jgi:hypothetical protein
MKTVKDLKIGDEVYFYFSDMLNIETRIVSDIVEVLPDQFKISIAGIGEVFHYHSPEQEKIHNYYLTLDQAKRQFISDKKGDIIAFQVARKKLDAKIAALETIIDVYRTDD